MRLFSILFSAILLFSQVVQGQDNVASNDFDAQVEKNSKYQQFEQSRNMMEFVKKGERSLADGYLKSLVPDAQKTAVDYFIVANMLFKADPDTSYAYMKKANQLLPNTPSILYELAIDEHRLGNCQTALPLYQQASHAMKNHNQWAYMAHCHLVLGDAKSALAAWSKANFGEYHTSIEKAMYEIFGDEDPARLRDKWVTQMNAGSTDAMCELMEQDKNWTVDWWNSIKQKQLLEHDIKTARQNPKMQEVLNVCHTMTELSDMAFLSFLQKNHYWGASHVLPRSNTATYVLIREINKRHIKSPAQLLKAYEIELLNRHQNEPNNQRNLDVLAFLYSQVSSNKLKQIDWHGWKNLKLEKYAASYISGLSENEADYQSIVSQAALDFPNNAIIQKKNWQAHAKSKDSDIYLMRYVASEFANVKNNWQGPNRLNNFMASLAQELHLETAAKN